ncbi:MAG: hypothetical protein ACO3I0_01810 [Limisphaerales bacterium]
MNPLSGFPFSVHAILLSAALLSLPPSALAQRVPLRELEIDPAQSHILLSGTATGVPLQEQAPGSLSNSVHGVLRIVVSDSTLQFDAGTRVIADTNGSWQPLPDGRPGSAPGCFGGAAESPLAFAVVALRGVELLITSDPIPVEADRFVASGLLFQFPTNSVGALAYRVTGFLQYQDWFPLEGLSTNGVAQLGEWTDSGQPARIRIPLDATYRFGLLNDNDSTLRVQGMIVASEASSGPPEILSMGIVEESFRVSLRGASGRPVTIQTSPDLMTWDSVGELMMPPSGEAVWSTPAIGEQFFFRFR